MQLLTALFLLLLAGCANLQTAEAPVHRWTDVHLFGVTAIAFNENGSLLASGGHRGEIAIWHVTERTRIANAIGLGEPVRALQWLGDRLVSGDRNGLTSWRGTDLGLIRQIASSGVAGLAASQQRLFSAHADGTLRAWHTDLQSAAIVGAAAELIALATDGQRVAVAASDGQVRLYDFQLKHLTDMENTGVAAHDLRFSADGQTLLGGGWFRLLAWDTDSGRSRSLAAEHNGLLTSVDISLDNRWIATIGRHTDSAIRVWQRDNYQIVRRLAAHDLCGAMIRFSPDGRFLASASDDESIALFDLLAAPAPR